MYRKIYNCLFIRNMIAKQVGNNIKYYRKLRKLSLVELGNKIHKSKATLSKYENGEIVIDIETLSEIANALEISMIELINIEEEIQPVINNYSISPFISAKKLYFYYYDGILKTIKEGVIDIKEKDNYYQASLSITHESNQTISHVYYTGDVVYSDMLIRFNFINKMNPLEQDLLYITNPLEIKMITNGLLCGISSSDLKPVAFKCVVSITRQEINKELKSKLKLNQTDLTIIKKYNMLMIDKKG